MVIQRTCSKRNILPFLSVGLVHHWRGRESRPKPAAAPDSTADKAARCGWTRDPANTTNERDKVQIDQFFGEHATNATGHCPTAAS
jgi:hypothetical protein